MIFIDKMKNFKIYKTPMFLPTLENDKKKKSAILLMTPSYASSKKLLDNPLFINRLRYESYYIDSDVSYYIGNKNIEEVEDVTEMYDYQTLTEMSSESRNKLKDSDFGLPNKRKYPLDTESRVRSAIKFFNYCSDNEEKELADNIKKAMKKFNITDVKIGNKNRLSNYITEETRIDPDKLPKFIYHISAVNHDGETFEPRKYDNDNVKNGMERYVSRVCFADSIQGCLYSIFPNGAYDADFYVHIPAHEVKVYSTTKDDIYDSEITHELWVKEPVKMKCIGKIHVSGVSNKKTKVIDIESDKVPYNKKKYHECIWRWVDKYDKDETLFESVLEADLSNFTWYHLEKVRKGFNPKTAGGWDEELYCKNINDAIHNDIKFEDGEEKVQAHVYTVGEELSAIYLGIITINKPNLDGYFNWEWSKQEPIADAEVSYLKDEVQKHLLENNKYHHNDSLDALRYSTEYLLSEVSGLNTGDKLILFNEDAKNDSQLRRILYSSRMRKRQELLALYDQVKSDFEFIKYAYPDLNRYQKRNLFVDLYFYNSIFFQNNTWTLQKGFNLYLDFVSRLINNPNLKEAGYENKTIFIPVIDWDINHDGSVWNYRQSLNPMSIMYHMMFSGNMSRMVSTFENINLVFVGKNEYFKINFSEIDVKETKNLSIKFKSFLMKICKSEDFDYEDIDTTSDNVQSAEVIKANIADKIELAKGVDITPQLAEIKKNKKNAHKDPVTSITADTTSKVEPKKKVDNSSNKNDEEKSISKATENLPKTKSEEDLELKIKTLAQAIDTAGDINNTEDDALDYIDDETIRNILIDLDAVDDDKVDISAGRAARISELDKKLLATEIKGKSIKDILEDKSSKKTEPLKLELSTPNECWNELNYAQFDKKYNIEQDIISIFRFFENVSRPISIRNIEVIDNSTSEDRVDLYKVEMEDYRGKRFTINLDIPIMKDNRFLLRGNSKSIQTQFFNMPIIKTDFDTCQIISNYMKIFVRRFGTNAGKSLPTTAKFIKAANKYTGRKIKFYYGDNSKICTKYELPIDYIDLSSIFSKIETDSYIFYFNQDEIRNTYTIEPQLGFPYMYNKKTKSIHYLMDNDPENFINVLLRYICSDCKEFEELFTSAGRPTVCTYSRASIMNSQIPLVVICGYHEGLRTVLEKANIKYEIRLNLTKEDRNNFNKDWIKFKDGYLIYDVTYASSLLLNGLKDCPTDLFELSDMDNKNMYLEFLDNFGGRIKADGLENFYDCMVDPLTKESLEFYKFPTDYVSILLYANALLADNKFIKHTDTSSRRFRRYELIAVYTYKVLADAYSSYANQLKHSREAAEFSVKQSAVIDKFLLDTISSDDSCINALRDVETTNSITTKGPSGMNSDRAYSLDKRTYDDSMLNVLGMSTGFAANVGITRQATINSNIDADRGYVKSIKGNTDKMNTANTLTATEALTPFGSTHDDPMRTAMTFIQTSKHMVRTEESDPLLVTNGSDEAMPYLTSDKFAFKAKGNGKVLEINDNYILVEYEDGTKDFVNLAETIEKNSDGGYFVPLKLDSVEGLKVGDNISENQILAFDKYSFSNSLGESDNIAYNIGKIAKVAIINTDEGFEDSGIITEALAEKLATRINLKFEVTLDKNTNLFMSAKVGQHVEAQDDLLIWQAPFDDEDANSLLKTIAGDDVSELGKRRLKSEVTGTITAIKVFRTVEIEELSESLQKFVNDYEAPYVEMEKMFRKNNLDVSQIPAHYSLEPTGKLKKAQDAIVVEYYVEYLDTVGIGDKIVYFSANKAVEKNIIPKGKEPYTEFRPNEFIDAFVSETSIDKRMVTSTLLVGSLQKLMIELDRSVKDILGIPYDDSKV